MHHKSRVLRAGQVSELEYGNRVLKCALESGECYRRSIKWSLETEASKAVLVYVGRPWPQAARQTLRNTKGRYFKGILSVLKQQISLG